MILVGHNFAESLAKLLNCKTADIEKRTFPDWEVCPRILSEVKDDYAIVAERMMLPMKPNGYFIEILLLVKNLKSMGVEKIDVVMPYFVYSRQDAVFRKGEPFSAKFVLEMLADAGATRFFTVSSHADRDKDMISFSPIPAYNINGFECIGDYLKGLDFPNPVIVGPDSGAETFVNTVAKKVRAEKAFFEKERDLETGKVTMRADADFHGKEIILIDDIVSSGSTMVSAIDICKKAGAKKIFCAVAHIVSQTGIEAISPLVDKFVACNTIHSEISVIPVEGAIAEKITSLKS
ncbi:MAG: ribose-phosphate diphosphokinase [Candidatus Aenigmarchaeota archaeon]|nr:ribose-phosphate diphosphokinase [Candidatus Aenigmarchaeota archaeon]